MTKTVDNTSEQAWQILCKHIRKNGQRVTPERKIILENIFSRHDHFTADQLAADLKQGKAPPGRATVFRTLRLMVEAGLVKKIRDDDTHAHFEHTLGHSDHDHMVCDQCGKYIEFISTEIKATIAKVCDDHRFKLRSHHTVLFGICEICSTDNNQ